MYGVVTRNESECAWSEFDRCFYEVKDVTGRSAEPITGAVNAISCFADNAAVDADPTLAPQTADGERATRERPYFDWDYVCPSRPEYREGLLEIVEDCVAESEDVRLDDVGFPRGEYCHCDACRERFSASEFDDRLTWRASVITDFLAEATDRIPGRTYLTLHPDPYPGHLLERSGLDLERVEPLVDEFVVPLYDTAYATTYWLETIASGFESALETPFGVELYAVDVDVDALLRATAVAEAYGTAVHFGYDASTARAAIRRRRAETRTGVTHGDPDG